MGVRIKVEPKGWKKTVNSKGFGSGSSGGLEVCGGTRGSMDQGEAGRTRDPVGAKGRRPMVEPTGRRAEVEQWA